MSSFAFPTNFALGDQVVHLAYPFALALPLLIALALLIRRKKTKAVLFPSVSQISFIAPPLRLRLRKPTLLILALLFVLATTIAASRPQLLTAIPQQHDSRNIILALDISKSMSANDFGGGFSRISRLEGVKRVVSEFVKARVHDRLGLVVFGSTAFLQSPLTLDHTIIEQLVGRLQPGLAGDGTAIGDGVGLSLKRIQEIPGTSKAIVLMTDGANNSGQVNPVKAAKVAADLGIKIHTIGIGSENPVSFDQSDIFFPRMGGRVEFDEKLLRDLAQETGGVYFNASNLEGLTQVYKQIDELEKSKADDLPSQRVEELFPRFVLFGLLALALYTMLTNTIFMKIP